MAQMEFPLLWSLVDTLNETYFYHQPVDEGLRKSVNVGLYKWLATTTGAMETDSAQVRPLDGAVLFTGERLKTQFAARHILLLEGGLALFRFGAGTAEEIALLQRVGRLVGQACFARQCLQGECALATVAWMRWLSSGLSPLAKPGIDHFLALMMENRDGRGRWVQFPFYYTLLALEEMRPDMARREMLYAAAACRRVVSRDGGEGIQERRRRDLAQRVLRAENPQTA